MKITVETHVHAPVETVWNAWTQPENIVHWNAASPDWHCPSASNDLRVGGKFCYRMEARDGTAGFDFEGQYTVVEPHRRIAYNLGENREVIVEFRPVENGTTLHETFTAESEHPVELQRAGWQSILDHFRQHAESLG